MVVSSPSSGKTKTIILVLSENIYFMHEEIFYEFHTAHTTIPNNELTSRHIDVNVYVSNPYR